MQRMHTKALVAVGAATVAGITAGAAYLYRGYSRSHKLTSLTEEDKVEIRSSLSRIYGASGLTLAGIASPALAVHLGAAPLLAPIYAGIGANIYTMTGFGAVVLSSGFAAAFLPLHVDLDGDGVASSSSLPPPPPTYSPEREGRDPPPAYAAMAGKMEVAVNKRANKIKLACWGVSTLGLGLLLGPLGSLSSSLLTVAAGYSLALAVGAHTTAYVTASPLAYIIAAPLSMSGSVLAAHFAFGALNVPFSTLVLPTVAWTGAILAADALSVLAEVVEDPENADPIRYGIRVAGSTTLAFLNILWKMYKLFRGTARTGARIADAVN